MDRATQLTARAPEEANLVEGIAGVANKLAEEHLSGGRVSPGARAEESTGTDVQESPQRGPRRTSLLL